MTIQIAVDPQEQKINVYQNHKEKVASLGIDKFSQAFDWNGEAVISFFLDVLTDCNYHSERKAIEKALKEEID